MMEVVRLSVVAVAAYFSPHIEQIRIDPLV
jgi:hypothetical protein